MNSDIPKHIPVDMAVAPDTKPFERKHVIHTNKTTQQEESKLAQHSLSPEKLGVVGYVKDVAGFVKDVVDDRRHRRRRSTSTSSIEEHNSNMIEERQEEKPRRRSSAEEHHHYHQQQQQQQQHPTGFADAVTGLFPGVNTIGNVNASGCTHADELRSQMMHINNEHQHDHNNKLL